MLLVFDLDETLISTMAANIQAYNLIGIVPPLNFNVRPWQEWCSKEKHEQKQAALPQFAHLMRVLPVCRRLYTVKDSVILTNASEGTLKVVKEKFPWLENISGGMSMSHKLRWLAVRPQTPGIYFDNDKNFCSTVRKMTDWQAVCVEKINAE